MSLKKILTLCTVFALALIIVLGWSPLSAATRKVVNQLRLASALNDGLVGYWSFDGKDMNWGTGIVTDVSPSGNNGVVSGMATTTAPVAGIAGQALNFDGVNDYVDIPDISLSNFTVTGWIKINGPTGVTQTPISMEDIIGTYFRFDIDTVNRITLYNYTGTTYNIGQTTLSTGRWYHIAGTRSGTISTFFVDGLQTGSTDTGALASSPGNGFIGTRNGGGGVPYYFKGSIDEARIYDRALSAGEVAYLYNKNKPAGAGTTVSANKNGLIGYWNFDSSASTTAGVTDLSGQGNHGTGYDGTTATALSTASSSTATASGGRIGEGGLLDGSNDNVDLGSAIGNLIGTGQRSFSLWAKADKALVNSGLLGLGASTGRQLWVWLGDTSSGGGFTMNLGGSTLASGLTPTVGIWYNVAGTWNGTTQILYINGVQVASVDVNSPAGASVNYFIGYINGYNYWKGTLDEVKIYNRALSAAEILAEYKSASRQFINVSQDTFMKEGLVGYWPFDGKYMNWSASSAEAVDASGQGNNGNVTNFGQEGARPGIVGQALNFDGSNDIVSMTSAAVFDVAAGSSHSVTAWIKPNSFANGPAIFVVGTNGVAFNYLADLNSSGVLDYGNNATQGTIGSTAVALNQWSFVSFSSNGSVVTGYINGVNVGTLTLGNSGATTETAKIGSRGTAQYFPGFIDEVRAYDRALSAAEVLQLYNSSKH